MATSKESFRDELEKLAKISAALDNSILSTGDVSIVVELDSENYQNIIRNFSEIYKHNEEMIIDISGTKFTFVLKK